MTLAFIDLEFDAIPTRGVAPGDIASSLVCLHDLLRDLGTIAADTSGAEFREIRVVAIEMGSPLKITLSLLAIPPEAVKAFQEICRHIIVSRERRAQQAASASADLDPMRLPNIKKALDLVLHAEGKNGQLTENETQRLHAHIVTLQDAEVPLKRVVLR